jgi:hypothetical protein
MSEREIPPQLHHHAMSGGDEWNSPTRSMARQVFGKVKRWGIFKFNTKDQADMYLRTKGSVKPRGVEYNEDI